MALVDVKVPDIGDFKDVAVIELLVKPGDAVKAEQSLVTVESDKASMEIPSSHAGVVKALKVSLGDRVSEGSVLLALETDTAAAPAPAPAAQAALPIAVPAPAPASAPAPAMAGGTVQVVVPDIGDFADVTVIEVFVKPGDAIKVEQSLITVESDKASMEIPSSHAGMVKQLLVKLGDKVSQGSPVALVEAAGTAGVAAPASSDSTTPAAAPAGHGFGPDAACLAFGAPIRARTRSASA
jgi:pyruvate dehydrogenase E2 component (dihydrolipoamide acetyltransferase)